MKLIEMSEMQKKAVDTFESSGGVVEFFLVDKNGSGECEESYREAAILGLKALKQKNNLYFERLLQLPDYRNRARAEFFDVTIDESEIHGHEISLKEFMGNNFSIEKRRLMLRGKTPRFLNEYFWVGEEESSKNAIKYSEFNLSGFSGYSDAFVEPPYNLSGTHQEINKMFWDVANNLFGGFGENCRIWSWSTDCSNYFDAGNEWWGTYFYTYSSLDKSYIVVLFASSTD
ncbi:hypothetical protein [Pectobacterium aroidearum]|uniref:hypothetical protein n=1 Tax=Pectobacterium aroidearum TaxID=1201031 RepID=UPI00301734D6